MRELSDRQQLFHDYLIARLGFANDDFISLYLYYLTKVLPKYSRVIWMYKNRIQPIEESENKFNIIDFLMMEINIRRKRWFEVLYNDFGKITASDVSNFTYCPISYSISKSYKFESLESSLLGIEQHSKQILLKHIPELNLDKLNSVKKEESGWWLDDLINNNNSFFFDEIKNSKCLFSGHTKEKKYFKSRKGNFYSQPDYIFQKLDNDEIFVVEEKFQYVPTEYHSEEDSDASKKRNGKKFFDNHINQLLSYIYCIYDYKISYGYLIYWKYEMVTGYPNIVSCNVLRLNKNPLNQERLTSKLQELEVVINKRGGVFDYTNRNPKKCASCVSNLLCGHKTGNFQGYNLPYSDSFFQLKKAEFPEELRNDSFDDQNTI